MVELSSRCHIPIDLKVEQQKPDVTNKLPINVFEESILHADRRKLVTKTITLFCTKIFATF